MDSEICQVAGQLPWPPDRLTGPVFPPGPRWPRWICRSNSLLYSFFSRSAVPLGPT